MGKKSTRPGRANKDVHEAIREAAQALRNGPLDGYRAAGEYPELEALLRFARKKVEDSAPKVVEFEGRRYWLRCRMAIELQVFDHPTSLEPLLTGALINEDPFGHAPGH